jgi:predicted Zn-dependent protease with MMP-like domain
VCTHQGIVRQVWGGSYGGETDSMRVHVYRLRRKLGDPDGRLLHTAPGVATRWRRPDRYASAVFAVSPDRFEELALEALDQLPAELARAIENVAVIVEDRARGRPLFGLYEGIPLTHRSPLSYSGVMPDRITLFQETISEVCYSEAELVEQIRKTVIHEVAHHFGISDPRLEELGWA